MQKTPRDKLPTRRLRLLREPVAILYGIVENNCPILSGWNKQGGLLAMFLSPRYARTLRAQNNGVALRDEPGSKWSCWTDFFEPTRGSPKSMVPWRNVPHDIFIIIQHPPYSQKRQDISEIFMIVRQALLMMTTVTIESTDCSTSSSLICF